MTDREPSRFSDTRKSDNITLPRAVALQIRAALEAMQSYAAAERKGLRICDEAVITITAALAEPEKERAEVAAPARGEIEVSTDKSYREHVTDGSPCWCNPELTYRDPDTGTELWIHRREQ
jgi:hypothetical protein